MGSELYFDISTELRSEANMPKLLKQIAKYGNAPEIPEDKQRTDRKPEAVRAKGGEGGESHVSPLQQLKSDAKEIKIPLTCRKWSVGEVQEWLLKGNLGFAKERYFELRFI